MSLFATLTAELRASPSYIAPCALCSFLEIPDAQNIIVSPSLHRRSHGFSLIRCCRMADGCPNFDTAEQVAQWWRVERQQPLAEIALENRRKSTLAKLARANLEPLDPKDLPPPSAREKWQEQAEERKLNL